MIQQAYWIAPKSAEQHIPCHFRVQKTFSLSEIPAEVLFQITCDGNYFLEINGHFVGRGPARGTRTVAYYDEYDVASFLRKGENTISILSVCMVIPVECTQPVTPAVRAACGKFAVTDLSWESFICSEEWPENGPFYTSQSGFAEWRDLRKVNLRQREETSIIPPGSPLSAKELLKRDIPLPLESFHLPTDIPAAAFVPPCDPDDRETAVLSTKEAHFPLPPGSEGALYALVSGGEVHVTLPFPPDKGGITLVADFSKEISGFLEVDITAPEGCIADVVYEEELFQKERLRADHTHTNPQYKFSDRYILKSGRQKFGGVLLERGFRLVQLTFRNLSAPVTLHAIRALDRRYPFAKRGAFFCGDYQLNRLWETAAETVSACTTDIFTDCPWRERLFYCNDYYIENRTALKMFGDKRIHQRAMGMIFSSHRSDDLFTSCSPSMAGEILDEGKTDFHVILSGNLTLPLVLKDYYMHTNDGEAVEKYFPQLKRMLERFTSWKDEKGILRPPLKYWNFFDWSFELNGMTFSGKGTALLNFLFIIAARAMLFLAGERNLPFDLDNSEIDTMLEETVKAFYLPEKNIFVNTCEEPAAPPEVLKTLGVPLQEEFAITESSRLVHAMAALAGAPSGLCAPLADEKLLTPELYYCIFLLDAMESMGNYDDALKLIRRHWGPMLDSGTPTLWENGVHKIGKEGFGGSASLCHGFSSAPAAFLQSAVLGVKPLAPGFERFRFAPCCPETGFAKGSVPTPHGAIRCSWQLKGTQISAELHVPEKCTAETPAGVFTQGDWNFSWNI